MILMLVKRVMVNPVPGTERLPAKRLVGRMEKQEKGAKHRFQAMGQKYGQSQPAAALPGSQGMEIFFLQVLAHFRKVWEGYKGRPRRFRKE